jgi:hypothetical protein
LFRRASELFESPAAGAALYDGIELVRGVRFETARVVEGRKHRPAVDRLLGRRLRSTEVEREYARRVLRTA